MDNGGPAFPIFEPEMGVKGQGMSLRDYFAGQVLVGYIAGTELLPDEETIARISYKMADAMLKEREKGNEQ